jgi:hypothetical protein
MILTEQRMYKYNFMFHALLPGVLKLLASVDISTRAPWITLNEQHIMAV